MAMEYFPWYDSYYTKTAKLSDQELGRLVRALMKFKVTGEHEQLAGRESVAYDFIVDDITRACNAYDTKCRKMRENGKANATKCQQLLSNDSKGSQSKSKDKSKSKSNAQKKSDNAPMRYGEFENVVLSYDELEKIKDAFPDWQAKIDNLSAYMQSTGKKYKSHYATILTWARRDGEKQQPRYPKKNIPMGGGELGDAEMEALKKTLAEPAFEVPFEPWEVEA